MANERVLNLLDHDYIVCALQNTITNILGRDAQPISLNLHLKNSPHLDCGQAYKDKYPSIPTQPHPTLACRASSFHAAWHPKDFIYTDGSQDTENPTLGASIVSITTDITTRIDIKSHHERHTINRAELAAITLALETNRENQALYILMDSAFIINTLRKYVIDPLSFVHHPHKDLLKLANEIIRT